MEILREAGVISLEQARAMASVMGFRNVAVHDHTALDPAIVEAIVAKHLGDLEQFVDAVLAATVS